MTSVAIPPPPDATTERDPDVAVIAITHNSEHVVEPFLKALPDAMEGLDRATVVVVDNNSTDETVPQVRKLAPWVTVLESAANLGYGAGINAALRHVSPRQGAVVLNPDTVPARSSFRALLQAVQQDPNVGIAVPRLLDCQGRLNFSLRREPTVRRAFGEAILGGKRAARFPALSERITNVDCYVDGATADWATGAAMFVARRAIDAAGLWPEDYFLYSEETDYLLRVRDAGLGLRFVANSVIVHKGGEMGQSPWLWSLQAVNRTRLFRRRNGAVLSASYWCGVVLNEAIRAATGRATHKAALRALFFGHPQLVKKNSRS